jgi:hypothetical protein
MKAIINRTLGVPSIDVYCERFGSPRNAYRRIGYELSEILTGLTGEASSMSFSGRLLPTSLPG